VALALRGGKGGEQLREGRDRSRGTAIEQHQQGRRRGTRWRRGAVARAPGAGLQNANDRGPPEGTGAPGKEGRVGGVVGSHGAR
jgi:hypothetical protein